MPSSAHPNLWPKCPSKKKYTPSKKPLTDRCSRSCLVAGSVSERWQEWETSGLTELVNVFGMSPRVVENAFLSYSEILGNGDKVCFFFFSLHVILKGSKGEGKGVTWRSMCKTSCQCVVIPSCRLRDGVAAHGCQLLNEVRPHLIGIHCGTDIAYANPETISSKETLAFWV